MNSFYIGLSLLSKNKTPTNQALHDEGRRILGLLDGTAPGPILVEKGGRPYYEDRHADFSISHSGRLAAAAYYADSKNRALRVGCDIQMVHPAKNREGVARRFFTLSEQDYITGASGSREQINRFYHIWVLKEAYLKAKGLTIGDIEQAPSFAVSGALAGVPGMYFYLYQLGERPESDLCMLAACLPFALGPEIRWFSEESLPVSSIAEIYAAVSPEKTVSPKM